MSAKNDFRTEAPSLYKKPKVEGEQPAPVVKKEKKDRPKTSEGAPRPKQKVNRGVSGAAAARTLYIGKVYVDELDQDPKRSQQLNQERLKLLKDVFQRFGDVERFEPHPTDSFVHVAYKDRKNAEDAIAQLSQRTVRDEIMDELKEQLRKSKLPENVCPVLWKYRYEWSNKTAESPSDAPRPKTAVAKKDKVDSPKNVVAKNVVANGVAPVAQPEKKDKKKKEKKPVEKKEEPAKPKDLVIEKKPRVPTTQDLQLEAERARLTQDLEYLRTQHKSAQKELQNERDRCSSRDERIKRLEEEHGRVRQHSLTLENQLKTDMTWKQAADERTSKLREEIDHIQQQQLLVQTMLKNVSEL